MNGTSHFKVFLPIFFLAILVLSACSLLPNAETSTSATTTPAPAILGTVDSASTTDSTNAINTPVFEIPEPTPKPKTSLIIWLPPEIASRTEAGAVVFSDQLLAFNNTHPDLIISVEQKSIGGQGGILNYLRTGEDTAPTILPDLIAIPVRQITAVSDEGLISPLEDVIDPASLENLYPVAQSWATYKDHIFAYPFALTEMPQIEFGNTITETPSLQWQTFISDTTKTMVLPAIGGAGAKLALQYYLQAGGALTNEAGQPALELEPLTLALQQFYNGRQNGFILQQSSNISTIDEARLLVQNGTTNYALSASDEFLKGRTEQITPGFAAIPGLNGSPPPLVRGWAWAISTSDPIKKAVAAELLATLTTEDNLGNWSLNSKVLPSNPNAFSQWPEEDAFVSFAHQELQRAEAMPLPDNGPLMKALEDAVFDVISLSKSPEDAALEAVTTLQTQP